MPLLVKREPSEYFIIIDAQLFFLIVRGLSGYRSRAANRSEFTVYHFVEKV